MSNSPVFQISLSSPERELTDMLAEAIDSLEPSALSSTPASPSVTEALAEIPEEGEEILAAAPETTSTSDNDAVGLLAVGPSKATTITLPVPQQLEISNNTADPSIVRPSSKTSTPPPHRPNDDVYLPANRTLCWRCGYPGHRRESCTGKPVVFCSRCGRVGWMSKECRCGTVKSKVLLPEKQYTEGRPSSSRPLSDIVLHPNVPLPGDPSGKFPLGCNVASMSCALDRVPSADAHMAEDAMTTNCHPDAITGEVPGNPLRNHQTS